MSFLNTPRSVRIRRVALIVIALIVAYRTYGGWIADQFRASDPTADIVIARSEFRTDLGSERPAWFIRLHNTSNEITYDQISLEATYMDSSGAVVETDTIVVDQVLGPGEQQDIGSPDPRSRPGAANATLRVLTADVVERPEE